VAGDDDGKAWSGNQGSGVKAERQRTTGQPAVPFGNSPDRAAFRPADQLDLGNGVVTPTHAHPMNHLP